MSPTDRDERELELAPDCAALRPHLHRALDEDLDEDLEGERALELRAHLVACPSCRAELVAERALSDLLRPATAEASRPRSLARPVGLVALAGLVAAWILSAGSPVYGSVEARAIPQGETAATTSERPLAPSNHFEVEGKDSLEIRVRGAGRVSAAGPAAFELDATAEGWKLNVRRGELLVELEVGVSLRAVTDGGASVLGPGRHRVTSRAVATESAGDDDPAELLRRGLAARYRSHAPEDMSAAVEALQAVARHSAASDEQRNTAMFHLAGPLQQLGRIEEALAAEREWLAAFPDDPHRDYALYFVGVFLRMLGREQEALDTWRALLEEIPGTDMREHVERALEAEGPPPRAARPSRPRAEVGVLPPLAPSDPALGSQRVSYVVVAVALGPGETSLAEADAEAFRAVAARAAERHGGEVIAWDGRDETELARRLAPLGPRDVLLVLATDRLDVDLHRRVLLASATLDPDPFPDFAFGYLTAADGRRLRALWERTLEVLESGLSSDRWLSTAVTTGECWASADPDEHLARAGFEPTSLYFGIGSANPGAIPFARAHVEDYERAGVVAMTGNGDPQGVWLFDDHRNLDRSKHWEFSPERVGDDPGGEMPRLTAAFFRELDLAAPVVWSGTCHSAAVGRVFVEGDIVSTFGRVGPEGAVYGLRPDDSLGLALLDAGAVALLAPIAANHGYATLIEREFALANGATLGETIKSTWDDVFLQAGGAPALDLPASGVRAAEDPMQGGGANRILIGDPALAPFRATPSPVEEVTVERLEDGGLAVRVARRAGFHARSWNMFGYRDGEQRIDARVDVAGLLDTERPHAVEVEVVDAAGRPLPFTLRHAVLEDWCGRRILHLQANAPRDDGVARAECSATFRLKPR